MTEAEKEDVKFLEYQVKMLNEKILDENRKQRDRFAAAALTGLIAHHGNDGTKSAAEYSYQFADAMMAEREKRKEK